MTGSQRRTDVLVAVGAAAVGLGFLFAAQHQQPPPQTGALVAVDTGLGVLASALLLWRRRFPVWVSLACALCDVSSLAALPAALVSVYTVASRRRSPSVLVAVVVAHEVAVVGGDVLKGSYTRPLSVALSIGVVLVACTAWGLYVGARRQLVASLRERADRLARDRERELSAARVAERTRIAQEIHDVLAHRISLISLHAGGLRMTPGLDPRSAESAALIGDTARAAMAEVRDAIGVLRDRDEESTPSTPPVPQPTLTEIPDLVGSSADAGLDVALTMEVEPDDAARCPAGLGRHAYRSVQEGLANVAKHTDGAATRVLVRGAPGGTLIVDVTNQLRPSAHPLPGGGRGLVALHERVTSAGGVFESGPRTGDDGDEFVLHAELAWPRT